MEKRKSGTVKFFIDKPLVAGRYSTWKLLYIVGETGIAEGGWLRIAWDYVSAAGYPNVTDPKKENYVTCSTSGNCKLKVQIPAPDSYRRSVTYIPMMSCNLVFLEIKVEEGSLAPGDTITVIFGDKSQGGPGYCCPRFAEYFNIWVLPDINGKYKWISVKGQPEGYQELLDKELSSTVTPLPDSPCVKVKPDSLARLVAIVPSICELGKSFTLHVVGLDRWNNPINESVPNLKADCAEAGFNATFDLKGGIADIKVNLRKEGIYRFSVFTSDRSISVVSNPVQVRKKTGGDKVFWGDLHCHTSVSDGHGQRGPDEAYTFARRISRLDFCAITDHAFGCIVKGHWEKVQKAVKDFYESGRFITLLGYEVMPRGWGDEDWPGHRNIYYKGDRGKLLFGDYQPGSGGSFPDENVPVYKKVQDQSIRRFDDLRELWKNLDRENSLVIAHHAGSWDYHDEQLQRLVEVCSQWGISEAHPKENLSALSFQKALKKGLRLGFVGGSDDHRGCPGNWYQILHDRSPIRYPSGLTAVLASELTRESVWEALLNRRTYATTGARIIVNVFLNGMQAIGQEFSIVGKPVFEVRVSGTAVIDRIEVWKDAERYHTFYSGKQDEYFEFSDNPPERPSSYYFRVLQVDGEVAWTSPTWIKTKK